jgi:hypothetical protein
LALLSIFALVMPVTTLMTTTSPSSSLREQGLFATSFKSMQAVLSLLLRLSCQIAPLAVQ